MTRQRFPKEAALLVPGVDYPKPHGCNYDPDRWTICQACWRADLAKFHHPDFWRQWLIRSQKCEQKGRITGHRGGPFPCNRPAVTWLGSPARHSLTALCQYHTWERLRMAKFGWCGGLGLGESNQLWAGGEFAASAVDIRASEEEMALFALTHPKPNPLPLRRPRLL